LDCSRGTGKTKSAWRRAEFELPKEELENPEEDTELTHPSPNSEEVAAEAEVQNTEVTAEAAAAPSDEPVAEAVVAEEPAENSAAQAEEMIAETNSPAETSLPSTTSLPAEPDLPSAPAAETEPAPTADPALMQETVAREMVDRELCLAPEQTQEQKTAEKVAAALKARGQDAEQSPFSVIVSQVYDGPLDLLLDLIRKQDIDIYDIPIAKITAQFLAYVDQLKASDMDVAGEFIYTAALLIHIKSRMLLPRAPAGPEEAAEDPRRELVERLLEHERFKNAAQMLKEKQMVEAATWTNPGAREFREDEDAESETAPEIAADTVDLVRVFREILERARNRPVIDVEEDTVTVSQMIQFLARRLTMEDKPVALRRLLSHTRSERALIATFLALLELVRLQAILLRQDRHFSEIFIKKHTGFDAAMNQGLANARDDWR
jgi:segregation and condensation protein A